VTTPDELYAAILADPDDMALRLRFADAIEASDPDHAELIRLQIEYDRLRIEGLDLPTGLAGHISALKRRLSPRLAAPIADLVSEWGLRRGFPELIKLPGADFLTRAAEIYRRVPVRHALLRDVDTGLVSKLAASPLLAQLSSLDLSDNPIGDDGVRALVASPYLGRLRWLGLVNCDIGADGVEAFAAAASRVLPNLRYLRFTDGYRTDGNRVDFVPYGVGQDIDGRYPTEVGIPERGARLNAQYGPFPWMDEGLAWRAFVDFSQV
jgi:uncharacterized protein (TIGR02996 family)